MNPRVANLIGLQRATTRLEMKFSLLFASIFVQAVLHKGFVGAKSDKLLERHIFHTI
jgi:hypothetical protein